MGESALTLVSTGLWLRGGGGQPELMWATAAPLEKGWWRGLDSNQRTLARADLQSAAFNHSATSPSVQAGAPCGGAPKMSQRAPEADVPVAAVLACELSALQLRTCPRQLRNWSG